MNQGFDDAVAQYVKFLENCGYPQKLMWVTRKDVLFTGSSRIYIRTSDPDGNAAAVRKEYEAGIASTLGVEFRTLCVLNDATCCYVWCPRDQNEAQRMMMPADGSLKMSSLSNHSKIKSKGVRNWLVWKGLKWMNRDKAGLGDLAFR
jgi:hypothetical protein